MTDDRKGGAALIAGAVLGLLTMSLHPSGRDLLATGQFSPTAFLAGLAHAIAIASMPLSFLGALALSRRLAAPDRLAVAALVVYGFALAAGLAAATLSGFVAPGLARQLIDASPPATDHWRVLFQYNGLLNQAFARVLVVASATAIVLWSLSIVSRRALAPGVGIYGLVSGPVIVVAVVSGHLRLDVHGFGLVVLAQSAWFIIVGVLLWRVPEA